MPINTQVSATTFQNMDGSNFTTAGVDGSVKIGNGSLGGYAGIGTQFTNGSTGVIADVKGSVPYGNSVFSGGFRIRNNINGNSQTVQFRVQPATANIPLSDKVSIYATPYGAAKVNYATGKTDVTFGGFGGVSAKVGNAKVFVEGQIYDVTDINKSTTGINAGVSIPL